MAKIRTYRDIVAWQKGMELARTIYIATRRMPENEKYGLTRQIRRAAVSVPSNIAEGFGRGCRRDLLKFLRIARGSLNELATQYTLSTELNLIEQDDLVHSLIAETDRVLQAFIRSLEQKDSSAP
jgi:four helix bundle protein